MSDLSTIFANVLAQAAELPRETGATARAGKRAAAAGTATVVLADVSGSMQELAGQRAKHQLLQEALDSVLPQVAGAHVVAFNAYPVVLPPAAPLPYPAGGTALDLALDAARGLQPGRTIVISDGQPNDEHAALAAADRCPGRIDVIYVGPDCDEVAIAFMRRLARTGGGIMVVHDLRRRHQLALASTVRTVLALPERTGR